MLVAHEGRRSCPEPWESMLQERAVRLCVCLRQGPRIYACGKELGGQGGRSASKGLRGRSTAAREGISAARQHPSSQRDAQQPRSPPYLVEVRVTSTDHDRCSAI